MRQKGFAPIIILIILALVVGLVYYVNKWTPPCVYQPIVDQASTPKPIETNRKDLAFLNEQDKQKIYRAIDSAQDAKDLDSKLYNSLIEVMESYEAEGQIGSSFVVVPDFLSDNPKGIIITSGGCKANLLANMELSPIKKADMPTLKSFAKLFIEETSKYPLAWWDEAIPPFIVFVKTVKVQGEVVGGVEQGAVIYNISSIDTNKEYARRIIHHELMHWLEHSSLTRNDTGWPANTGDYLGTYDLGSSFNNVEYPEIGFITSYAKTNSYEDKAEVYSYLFTTEGLKKLNKLMKNDKSIKKKVEYLKYFIWQRVNKMDDKYFEDYILGD